jgi:hypothetical protein
VDLVDHDNPFDQYGEYRFSTVATHSTIPEEEYFYTVMYTDFSDMVDDVIDNLHLAVVSNYTIFGLKRNDLLKLNAGESFHNCASFCARWR